MPAENSQSSASTLWLEKSLTKEIWSSHWPLKKEQNKCEKRWKNLIQRDVLRKLYQFCYNPDSISTFEKPLFC